MRTKDVEPFVSYWHDGGADLAHLGIDPAKLGTRDETRKRFEQMVSGSRPRQALVFTITLGYPVADTRDLDAPDGLAEPGTFHIYEIPYGSASLIADRL